MLLDIRDTCVSLQVAFAVLGVGIVALLVRAYRDPLKDVPGPTLARFTRLYELVETWRGGWEHTNIALHRQHGPIVRIAPNRFSINDPTAIRVIYGPGSKFSKSDYYLPFGAEDLNHKDIFSETDNAKHAAGRRKSAAMYAMSALVAYEPFVDKVNAELDAKLADFARTDESFDLFTWMQFYAFDVIGEITIGASFGLLAAGTDKDGLLEAIDFSILKYGAMMGLVPEWHAWYLAWIKMFRRRTDHYIRVTDPVRKLIQSRKDGSNQTDRLDFMSKCLSLAQQGKLDPQDMLNILGGNVGAGSDTTGISLTAVIYHLTKNPDCMARLRAELQEARDKGMSSDPISFRDSQQLPYLQAVIKEALRLHPAVGAILPRVVPEGGSVLAGHYFPAGTVVGVNAWVIHTNTDIWGEDATEFRPERWLVAKEKLSFLEQNFLAFGAGARTCIGKNISLLEMNKMLPQILQRYDFKIAQDNDEWETRSGWFVKQYVKVKVERVPSNTG